MKHLKLIFACLLTAIFSIGQVWAAEQVAYTLAPATGSNNSYAGNCDVTISGITWNVTGNATMVPWRIGGKNLSGVNREVYSKTAMSDAITKVELEVGTASSVTVNSLKLIVASNADFSTVIDEVTKDFAASSTITFAPTSPATEWAKDAYFKFVFNVTIDGTNKYVQFSGAKFYKEVSTETCETPTFSPAAGTFYGSQEITLATTTTGASIYYTTDGTTPSSTNGTLYEDPFEISSTTTVKAIAVKDGATDSGVAEATYTAGATVSSYVIDFETNNLAAYVNWVFDKLTIRTTTIAAHGGTYYAINATSSSATTGTGTATITTAAKIATPGALTFWTSKESGNTTASSWIAQVSDDGDTWTDAGTFDATTGAKGDWTERTADLSAYTDVYVRIAYSGSTAIRAIDDISLSTTPSLLKPTIEGAENFVNTTEVTITHATADAIYYTTNGDAPTTSSTEYTAPFELNATATVKAIAVKGGESSEVATKTFTKIVPWTVAEANEQLGISTPQNGKYVRGIISQIDSYGSNAITYWISDDGSTTDQLEVYKGKNLNNTNFSAITDLALGDVVVVYGNLKVFTPSGGGSINEFDAGNYLVSKEAPAVAAPVFSPDGGGFMGETDVTITCETAGSAIYYTTNGETPSKSSDVYDAPIHLNATTTITAIAYVGDDASLVVTKTFTLTAPMTVSEALTALDTESPINNAAVSGIISTAPTANPSSGKLTYYISDDGTDTDELEVFLGFGLNGASFSAKTDLQVGDEVTVFGNLTIFSSTTKEFASGSRLLAFNRPVVAVSSVSLPATETVEVGSTVTLTATVLPANASDKSITWTVESGSDKASVADGVVSGLVAGEAVIRATSVADGTKYAKCTVTVVAADPTKHIVTFDATVDKGESPLSKSNITFTCSNGALNNGSEYRLYKSSTTTFACSVGNITKIEFTGVSGNPVSGFGDPEVGTLVTEGNNGVWTGNAESVSFVASGAQVRATEIVVTYKEDNRAAAGLAWSTDAVELTVGETFTAPTLTNPNSISASAITIASDNTDLATVSAGVVSLIADATGTATITATFEGNEDYKPAVVSYTITVNEAGLDNVTFDATLDIAETGELSISKAGFTLEFTGGAMDNSENYRLYKSQTMTLSSSSYLIKKIEFTCTSGNPISGFADAEGLDKANNQWTGEANSVELTASNAQVRIEKLKVYYIEDTRAASGLAWSTDEIEITLGDAFTPANLVNPNSIDASAITIESDNTDLAVVNDGVVSLVADATGTAHIKAIFAGNATYKPAKISYTIIVNDPTPTIYVDKLNVNFGSVEVGGAVPAAQTITVSLTNVAAVTATLGGTNPEAFSISKTEGIVDDDVITISVLASTAAEASYSATIAISDGAEGADDKTVNLSFAVTAPASDDDVSGTWTLVTNTTTLAAGKKVIIAQYVDADGAINTMAGQASNNRSVIASSVAGTTLTPTVGTKVMTLADAGSGHFYLKTSDGEYLYNASSSTKSYLRTKAEDEDASWTIEVSAQGKATITSVENTNRINMRYNPNTSGTPLFNCYASGQNDIALYMHEDAPEPVYEELREGVVAGRYYTVCLSKKVVAFRGGNFWSMSKRTTDMAFLEEEKGELPAGTPYIFEVTGTKLEVVYEGAATDVAGTNGALHGTFVDMDQDALSTAASTAGSDIWLLSNNQLYNVTTAGADGNSLSAGRAYIVYGDLDEVSEAPHLPGRRVRGVPMQGQTATALDNAEASEKPMKMMIDGQLFIIRGEKMYDATGRLVK